MAHFNPVKHTHNAFILDLPLGQGPVKQQLAEMQSSGRPYQTAAARIELLRNTLSQLQDDPACLPETRATLQRELAVAYHDYLGVERAQYMETALDACEAALQVYTLTRYPYQHASLQITLGSIYRERIAQTQRDNLERAIACDHEALRFYTLEAFPYE